MKLEIKTDTTGRREEIGYSPHWLDIQLTEKEQHALTVSCVLLRRIQSFLISDGDKLDPVRFGSEPVLPMHQCCSIAAALIHYDILDNCKTETQQAIDRAAGEEGVGL